ncbi:outer membrane beta-barrel protein [Algicella marina]|uniref:Outer membrane beta-barrel protein n=2 Tax=Algicella marina TaxID=2683284 RepID=A0A6P1T6E5_9RHOB|nr:outer membrane beta-barrel protein [Algicella marina]
MLATPLLAGNPVYEAPADPVVAPAPVAVAPVGVDWTGFYAGAQAGYGFGTADDGADADFDGAFGGVLAGYNYDFGRFVVGSELDLNIADLSIDGGGEIDQLARLKLKGGVEVGRALLYGTAGGAYANVNAAGGDLSDYGYVVGAGVDYLVSDNIVAGVEYLYHDFNDIDDSGIDATAHTVGAKVAYKF